MPFSWTERQFVGGELCLDLVNTVFYAEDPARRGDRLHDGEDVASWCAAAERFGAAGDYAAMIRVPARAFLAEEVCETLLLRQAVDDLYRPVARARPPSSLAMRRVLFALGGELGGIGIEAGGTGLVPVAKPSPAALRAAIAHSALVLAMSPLTTRMKSCPNCNWLFVDRSRNASRRWCDMLTCGNRAKAQRHYGRQRTDAAV